MSLIFFPAGPSAQSWAEDGSPYAVSGLLQTSYLLSEPVRMGLSLVPGSMSVQNTPFMRDDLFFFFKISCKRKYLCCFHCCFVAKNVRT